MEWMDMLVIRTGSDAWYQECLRVVKEREPGFLALLEQLTPQQQAVLDGYIAACEELEHALLPIAYQLGTESI